ncbi:hypothetical protein C7212DRAFT_342714 [Tuber magnatum]|uniref:Uncharacterized protein n=1 Tax=Tuber magnatum TaxID=42249 RepID=A0A317SST3_9PEZI|nr:hypothetical protein C7212DRAFT_342714 [Tuber magnatum]
MGLECWRVFSSTSSRTWFAQEQRSTVFRLKQERRLTQYSSTPAFTKSLPALCLNYPVHTGHGTFVFLLPSLVTSSNPRGLRYSPSQSHHHFYLLSLWFISLANGSQSSMTIQPFTLLLTQWALLTHPPEVPELESFKFSTTISLELSSPPQTLHLLPTLYTPPQTALPVPMGAICHSASPPPEWDWNPMTEPREGSFVVTYSSYDVWVFGGSSLIVRWRACFDVESLNLTLRRGRRTSIRNVSLIEGIPNYGNAIRCVENIRKAEISNDGEYPENANGTDTSANPTTGSDYALMIWTEDLPRHSISGFFTKGPANSISNSTVTPPTEVTKEYAACIDALSKRGYYNGAIDRDFISSVTPGHGIGTTTFSRKTMKQLDGFSLGVLPVGTSCRVVLGYGMVGLSALQIVRNVVGGFNEGLIDHGHRVLFSQANANSEGFGVPITSVEYIREGGGGSKETEVYKSTTGGIHMALSYNSPQSRLPPDMRSLPLPLLGGPSYNKGMNRLHLAHNTLKRNLNHGS